MPKHFNQGSTWQQNKHVLPPPSTEGNRLTRIINPYQGQNIRETNPDLITQQPNYKEPIVLPNQPIRNTGEMTHAQWVHTQASVAKNRANFEANRANF